MDEQKKVEELSEETGMSRGEFLKMVGAAGLGLGALGSVMSAPAQAQEGEGKKGKYLFVVTTGASNPNRTILSLLLADIVQKMELGSVQIFLVLEGAELAKVGLPEKIVSPVYQKFGNALELMERIRKNGGVIGICPPCADWIGAADEKKYPWVENHGGGVLLKAMQDSWTAWL